MYNNGYGYWYHYFAPFSPVEHSCQTGEGCHGSYGANTCEFYHWICSASMLARPERSFQVVAAAATNRGPLSRTERLAGMSQLEYSPNRDRFFVGDCLGVIVGQVVMAQPSAAGGRGDNATPRPFSAHAWPLKRAQAD